MVGNIIVINTYYNRIVVATNNKDQLQVYYLMGKIFYVLANFQPIQDSSFLDNAFQGGELTKTIALFNKLMDAQQ